MMPLELFNQVGGFDERYFMYYEEIDLFKKLKNIGYRVLYLPDVYVVHYGGESTKQQFARMRAEQQRSLLLYLKKWHPGLAAEMIRWFLILFSIARIVWISVNPNIKKLELSDRQKIRSTALLILRKLLRINCQSDFQSNRL
jgi:GT2 family glycosyltransferase